MKVRMKDNPELEFYSGKFNTHAIGEVLGCDDSFGVDLFFIKDLDVLIEKGINFFAWKDMTQAFQDHDLITDNFNKYFFEPENEEDRKRGFTLIERRIKMPYITENDRDNIDLCLLGWIAETPDADITLKSLFEDFFACDEPPKPGELNYIITTLIHCYIQRKDLCYTTLNEVIGVLECAKLELYRMIAAPYEDVKQMENGPISELDKDS